MSSDDTTQLTLEMIKATIHEVLDERSFVTRGELEGYAKSEQVSMVGRKVDASAERIKNVEHRLDDLSRLSLTIEELKEGVSRVHDIAQSTQKLSLAMADSASENRKRIDELDRSQDRLINVLNDVEIRAALTFENSKRTDERVVELMKSAQETHRMMSEFLIYQSNEKTLRDQQERSREDLLRWVQNQKNFQDTAGKHIKSILTFMFKTRVHAGLTLAVASVPVMKPIVETIQSLIGG